MKTFLQKTLHRLNFLKTLTHIEALNREILMAQVFHSSIADVDWLKVKSFSPSGHAANYSLLYILFRVLNDTSPKNILEFGIGQTTRLTSQYVRHQNPQAQLSVIEHDALWLDLFEKSLGLGLHPADTISLKHLDITEAHENNQPYATYRDLEQHLQAQKFDVILVDGKSSKRYSRAYALTLIPEHLSDSFVIILDDAHRPGEQQTSKAIRQKLSDAGIDFAFGRYQGRKQQDVICSRNLAFLRTL